MIKREPGYHEGRSRLVFAGQESLNGYTQISVKYESNPQFSTHYLDSPKCLVVRLLDRTLYYHSKTRRSSILLPFETDASVSIRRDLSHLKATSTDLILMNAIHAPKTLTTQSYVHNGVDVMFDSGGFQLVQGTTDFVSPADTANAYNKYATIGVGLDFPAPMDVDAVLYKENTGLQVLNNEYLYSHVGSHVSLAPVIHGQTPKTREWCLNRVYSKNRNRVVTVSGLIMRRADTEKDIYQKMACLSLVLDAVRKNTDYVHLLGCTSSLWLALFALLSKRGYVKSIGGDSVTYRQAAIGGSYNTYPHFQGSIALVQPKTTSVPAALPCPCPVCSVVKDARLLRDYRTSEMHHFYASASEKLVIDDAVASYITGAITRSDLWNLVFRAQAKSRQSVANKVFDYFEAVIQKGYKNVPKLAPHEGFRKSHSLLHTGADHTRRTQTLIARYKRVHALYEDFHGKPISIR